jgi:hypothetical protein
MPPKSLQGLVSSPFTLIFTLLKIMKNHKGLLIGSGFAASVFAFGIASGLISPKDAAIASLLAVPSALTAHIVTESIAQKRINQFEERGKTTSERVGISPVKDRFPRGYRSP